jgi:uncharacterized protein
MEFQNTNQSSNVEDRRGMSPAVMAGGGIGVTIITLVLAYLFNMNPQQAKNIAEKIGGGQKQAQVNTKTDPNDKFTVFSKKLMGSMENVWGDVFKKADQRYEQPKMVIFENDVHTQGCGDAPSAVGPFYCPADKTLYLDPSFFTELEKKLGGSASDFSKAYVIAHEVGHHVQNITGYSAEVDKRRKTRQENEYSVRLELQADYLAGVYIHHARKRGDITFDMNDVSSALKTANAIGDDVLQKRSRGWSSPESYTHGTAAQREKYFKLGLETGDLSKLKMFFSVSNEEL